MCIRDRRVYESPRFGALYVVERLGRVPLGDECRNQLGVENLLVTHESDLAGLGSNAGALQFDHIHCIAVKIRRLLGIILAFRDAATFE